MKLAIGITGIAVVCAVCILLGVISLYTAGALAAAQTVKTIPFAGDAASQRIEGWVMGNVEEHVIDVAPVLPTSVSPPIPIVASPMPPIVLPQPVDPDCATPYELPVEGPFTSYFGWRSSPVPPFVREFHDGIDISVPTGTDVKAVICGTVTYAGYNNLYGYQVSITNGNLTVFYGHNSQLYVAVGQAVKQGQIVAAAGTTGRSTGPHVHYGMHIDGNPVDPLNTFGLG